MNLYTYLYENYGYDNPIIVTELNIEKYSKNNIRQSLYLLEKNHKIERYSNGIYYLTRDTIFGKSKLNFEQVLVRKYISNGKETYGYFTGIYLKNQLGLTTQMPNIPEIISNKESSKRRVIEMRGREAVVKKSYIVINEENAKILQFFDLFKYLDFKEIETSKQMLIDYIKKEQFTKNQVSEYLCQYPKEVLSHFIRSGLIYEFA